MDWLVNTCGINPNTRLDRVCVVFRLFRQALNFNTSFLCHSPQGPCSGCNVYSILSSENVTSLKEILPRLGVCYSMVSVWPVIVPDLPVFLETRDLRSYFMSFVSALYPVLVVTSKARMLRYACKACYPCVTSCEARA